MKKSLQITIALTQHTSPAIPERRENPNTVGYDAI